MSMLRSKSILPWGVATLALIGAVSLAFRLLKSEPVDVAKSAQAHIKQTKPNVTVHMRNGCTRAQAPFSQANHPSLLSKQEEVLAFLHDTSVTYDPAELPKIQPYLLSPDLEVQKAAIDAMVVLGDSSAALMLREASRQVMDTNVVMDMLRAADYLELPPMDMTKMAVLLKNKVSSENNSMSKKKAPGRAGLMAKERQKRLGERAQKEVIAPDKSR